MNIKRIIWAVIVIVIIIGAVAFGGRFSKNTSQVSNEPIKLGAVLSLTGFAAPWGEYQKRGIDLAVIEINKAGGIDGRKVEVVFEDDATDGKKAVSAFAKLVDVDNVQGVIGGVFDFTAQPLIPLALADKVAFISASNFRIAGGFDLNDQSFVMMTDFNKVIRELKTVVSDAGIKKLAVVHYKSTFGNEIAKTLDEMVKENGQSGIVDEPYAEIGANDFKTTVAKLKLEGVDGVFLDMVGNDPVNFLKRAKEFGYNPKIISYNGIADSFADKKDKSLLENVIVLNWEVNSAEFTKKYQALYNAAPAKSADKAFDAVYVLAKALAETKDRSQVAEYIGHTTFSTPNAVIKFTPEHAVITTPVEIDVVKNGVLVPYKN